MYNKPSKEEFMENRSDSVSIDQETADSSVYGSRHLIKGLSRLLLPSWRSIVMIFTAMLLRLSFALIFPMGLWLIFDRAIAENNSRVLLMILGVIGCGFLVSAIASIWQDFLAAKLGAEQTDELRLRMFDKLHTLSENYYRLKNTEEIVSRFSADLNAIENLIYRGLPQGTYTFLLIICGVILLFIIEWHLALAVLLVTPIIMISQNILGPKASTASNLRKKAEAQMVDQVREDIAGQAVIKIFGLRSMFLQEFKHKTRALVGKSNQFNFMSAMVGRATDLCVVFMILLILGAGSFLVIQGHITTGALVAFVALLLNLNEGRKSLSQIAPIISQSIGGLKRIEETLDQSIDMAEKEGVVSLPEFSKEIRFHDVSFSHSGKKWHLEQADFAIKKGQAVAFVGSSGSGKSTIFKLLNQFHSPDRGKITIDDLDLAQASMESLTSQISAVTRDTFLFNTSIRQNISLGKPEASFEEIKEAAREAEIHDLIMSLPDQYETILGEGGGSLPEGQRQRLAIARALACKPKILILDEATAALDPGTETAINKMFKTLSGDTTIISITHRLAPVRQMDCIFVMDKGKIVEKGNHQELLFLEGIYHQLWNKQSGFLLKKDSREFEIEAARLKKIPILSNLKDDYLSSIAKRFSTEEFSKGQEILSQGNPGKRFYIIVKGSVEVERKDYAGQTHHLANLETGDHFGEISLLADVPITATVRARSQTYCLALPRDQFSNLLNEAPALRESIKPVMEERSNERKAITGKRGGTSLTFEVSTRKLKT